MVASNSRHIDKLYDDYESGQLCVTLHIYENYFYKLINTSWEFSHLFVSDSKTIAK